MACRAKVELALAVLLFLTTTPTPTWAVIDVEAYLIPVLNPGDTNPNVVPPEADNRYHLVLDWTVTPTYYVDLWVSDTGIENTGIVSAYTDITWDNGAITDAVGLTHDAAFGAFTEGMINNAGNQVSNFGGTDGTFQGQGIAEFVRVGSIEFSLSGSGCVDLEGAVGAGEYGVLSRQVGEIEIHGGEVCPEPASILVLGAGTIAFFGRRRQPDRE